MFAELFRKRVEEYDISAIDVLDFLYRGNALKFAMAVSEFYQWNQDAFHRVPSLQGLVSALVLDGPALSAVNVSDAGEIENMVGAILDANADWHKKGTSCIDVFNKVAVMLRLYQL